MRRCSLASLGHLVVALALVAASGCADRALPWIAPTDDASPAATSDMTVAPVDLKPYLGSFAWDSSNAGSHTLCDDGSSHVDMPPMGAFTIASGPGASQVNIGVGSGACPIFVFDVGATAVTLSNVGVRCASGPGFLTTRSGSIVTSDGGKTLRIALELDINQTTSDGVEHHCLLDVAGLVTRLH